MLNTSSYRQFEWPYNCTIFNKYAVNADKYANY